jgi:hypothetical protein
VALGLRLLADRLELLVLPPLHGFGILRVGPGTAALRVRPALRSTPYADDAQRD